MRTLRPLDFPVVSAIFSPQSIALAHHHLLLVVGLSPYVNGSNADLAGAGFQLCGRSARWRPGPTSAGTDSAPPVAGRTGAYRTASD